MSGGRPRRPRADQAGTGQGVVSAAEGVWGGRGLVGHVEDGGRVAGWPELACQCVRGINHLTGRGHPVPAPLLYEILGNLKGVGHLLPQALDQLGAGLGRSLEDCDVDDGPGRDAGVSLAQARELMAAAARAAGELGEYLERAQAALATQGYRPDRPAEPDRSPASGEPDRGRGAGGAGPRR